MNKLFFIAQLILTIYLFWLAPRKALWQRARHHEHRAQSRPVLAAVVKPPQVNAVAKDSLHHTPSRGVAELRD